MKDVSFLHSFGDNTQLCEGGIINDFTHRWEALAAK